MALNLFMVIVAVKAASLVFIVVAWRTYKPPRKTQTPNEGQKSPSENHVIGSDHVISPTNHVINKDHPINNGYTVYNGDISHSNDYKGIVSPVFVNDDGSNGYTEEITRF